jgi:hemerythrin
MDLSWNDAYTVNDSKIDKEHKKLFAIAAKAFGVVSPDQKINKVKTVLKELIDYTKIHFKDEEKFMESIGYPELPYHHELHENIIVSMNEFTKNLSKMKIMEIEKELAHFIEIWFIKHIIYVDKKIAQWQLTHEIPEFTFAWKNEYKIGNNILDAEHQELFKIASEAFKRVPVEEKMAKIKDTLNQLFSYFQKHFKDEEDYMSSIKYDKIVAHKKIHEDIIQTLTTFLKKVPKMKIEDIEDELKEFIDTSLVKHIVEEDKKIALWEKYLQDLKEAKELREM